jgi:hypothetical protein
MTDEPTPTPGKFYISKVIQKALVEATEKGTGAAAATAVVMSIPVSCCYTPPLHRRPSCSTRTTRSCT